jgi:hypothetical protein
MLWAEEPVSRGALEVSMGSGFSSLDEEAVGGSVKTAELGDMASFWGGSTGTIADFGAVSPDLAGQSIEAAPLFDDPEPTPEGPGVKPSHKRRRWRIVHHLVAHPLLVIAPKVGLRVHAWSCRKLYGERGEEYLTQWWMYQV